MGHKTLSFVSQCKDVYSLVKKQKKEKIQLGFQSCGKNYFLFLHFEFTVAGFVGCKDSPGTLWCMFTAEVKTKEHKACEVEPSRAWKTNQGP